MQCWLISVVVVAISTMILLFIFSFDSLELEPKLRFSNPSDGRVQLRTHCILGTRHRLAIKHCTLVACFIVAREKL